MRKKYIFAGMFIVLLSACSEYSVMKLRLSSSRFDNSVQRVECTYVPANRNDGFGFLTTHLNSQNKMCPYWAWYHSSTQTVSY